MAIHARSARFIVTGIAATAIVSSCDRPRDGEITADSAQQADSATVLSLAPYQGRLRKIDVLVESDTLPFLFDTGGGWTLVSPQLAERMNCRRVGRSVGHRMSGERLEVSTCSGDMTLTIGGGFVARPVAIGVFDLMQLLPPDWPPLHGVVSLSTFAGRAITLDLGRNQLTVETPASLERRTSSMTPLKVRLATGDDGAAMVMFVAAKADSGELWLEFDSGNLDDLLLAPHAVRALGARVDGDTAFVALELVGTSPIEVRTSIRSLIYDGVLNAGHIEQNVYTIDLATGRAWVARR